MASERERLLIRAITAGADRIREQRLKIGEIIRLWELRNLIVRAEPRLIVAYWVTS